MRLDKRGRKIGYNWWREFIVSIWHDATMAWERQAEEVALGYETETELYAAEHPRPTLKEFLETHRGMSRGMAGA